MVLQETIEILEYMKEIASVSPGTLDGAVRMLEAMGKTETGVETVREALGEAIDILYQYSVST